MKYLLICFGLISIAHAQNYNPDAVNKKASAIYTQALEMLQNDERREVIPVLQKAIQYDANFVDAYLSLGGVYGDLKDYANSVANYEKAISLDSIYTKYYLIYLLAKSCGSWKI